MTTEKVTHLWTLPTGHVVELTGQDLEVLDAVVDTFPGVRLESVKLPGIDRINLYRAEA